MICSRVRPARVGDVAGLTQIAVRATKHNGYDDGAISRFMPGLKINLALIAAGLVFVAEDEQGVPRGYVAFETDGNGGPDSPRRHFRRSSLFAGRCWHTTFRYRS